MGIMNSIKKTLGIEEEFEYEERDEMVVEETEVEKTENIIRGPFNRRSTYQEYRNEKPEMRETLKRPVEEKQVLNIVTPQSFEESLKVAEDFLEGKIIIINTSYMELRVAQRFLDFVSGTAFAIGGDINRVEDNIYILSPKNVSVGNAVSKDSTLKNLLGL